MLLIGIIRYEHDIKTNTILLQFIIIIISYAKKKQFGHLSKKGEEDKLKYISSSSSLSDFIDD